MAVTWDLGALSQAQAITAADDDDDEGEVDESGVEPNDIELVMTQVRSAKGALIRSLWPVWELWGCVSLPISSNFGTVRRSV